MEPEITLERIEDEAAAAMRELLEKANLRPGALVVVGCSSSEMGGGVIGHDSSPALAEAAFPLKMLVTTGPIIQMMANRPITGKNQPRMM